MKLRRLTLSRFRHFVDEVLQVDPQITALVGANDSGKTSIVHRFFDQYLHEGVMHGIDRTKITGFKGDDISYSTTWELSKTDPGAAALCALGGVSAASELEIRCDWARQPKHLRFWLDGKELDAYEVSHQGRERLREQLSSRRLCPEPYYISIGARIAPNERVPAATVFNASFADDQTPPSGMPRPHLMWSTEELMLRAAGLHARTRRLTGAGSEEPWDPPAPKQPSPLDVAHIHDRLRVF